MEEAEEERVMPAVVLCRVEESTGSKTGLGSADEAVLVVSRPDAEAFPSLWLTASNSSDVLNFPPWIGGTKLTHGSLIWPIL
jgi:hypothetical protein